MEPSKEQQPPSTGARQGDTVKIWHSSWLPRVSGSPGLQGFPRLKSQFCGPVLCHSYFFEGSFMAYCAIPGSKVATFV